MIAILKKEIRSYLYSVTGALFASVNLLILGLYFMANNLIGMSATTAPVMSSVLFVVLIMVPVLTMRSLAEERKLKTDQLLLTYPVSVFKVVMGKYLALLSVFMVPVAISCIYPIVLSSYGEVAYAESYAAVLGYFLFGAACLSVGLFISAITESQVIAAVLTFAALFLTYLMSGIVSILTSGGNNAAEVLNVFDFTGRMENIMSGVIDLKDIFYFLSVIALMLFLTSQMILKRRYTVSKKTFRLSVYSDALIVVVIAAVIGANYGVSFIPADYSEFDITDDNKFTLSDESREFLKTLDDNITIYCVGTKDMLDSYDYKELTHTLDQYDQLTGHIRVVYKDPSKDPTFTAQFNEGDLNIGTVIVTNADRHKSVPVSDMFQSEIDYQTYTQNRTGYDGEGQITGAIQYVITEDIPKVYVITGHGEHTLNEYPRLNSAIKKQNIETKEINLMNVDKIPADAEAVMIMGPSGDYPEDDAKKLSDYLKGGGNCIAAVGYTDEATPNLDGVFKEYGVERLNGIILEDNTDYMYQTPLYLLPEVESSVLTTDIMKLKKLCLVPEAAGFKTNSENKAEKGIESALVTSDAAYLKTDISENTEYQKTDKDLTGPFDIAEYIDNKDTKLALFGSDIMFTDQVDMTVGGANVQLIGAAIKDMVDIEITNAIPAKTYENKVVTVTYGTALACGLLFILLLPAGILVTGIAFWVSRRKL